MYLRFFLVLIVVWMFGGCSTKEVFEPQDVAGTWKRLKRADAAVVDQTANVAVLDNGDVLADGKPLEVTLQKGYRAVGYSGGYFISTDIDGHLLLFDVKQKRSIPFDLKKTIAAASTDGDVVAVVFASGEMGLYSLATKKLLMKIDGATSIALDARIVNPAYMNDLVLFLTLDGKVVVVNKTLKKRLRTVIVSAAEYFNNVIYFDIVDDKLIVATGTKILSFGASQHRAQYEARNIVHDKKRLYVATKQGDIVLLDANLNEQKKVHFPFAHFLSLAVEGDKVYALEKQGYMIVLSSDLLTYVIHEVEIDDEGYVYRARGHFVVDDEIIYFADENVSK